MQKLNKNELLNCSGGGFSFGLCLAIAAGITFLIGLVDGYFRPLPCR